MNLRAIAERFATETFEAFNETTLDFEPIDLLGRVSLVDRFQSIYNKPLRRRTLFHAPEAQFPPSFTIRNTLTGSVYLLGQTRQDARPDEGNYHAITVLHLVTPEEPNPSSGLVSIYRKVPTGPADNPGWLEEQLIAQHYGDFEFRTASAEDGSYEKDIESYVVHLPKHANIDENDFVELGSRRMRVTVTMADSGFLQCRMDEEDDTRVNMVLHHWSDERTYDDTLHRYVNNKVDYNFTGEVISDYEMGTWLSDSTSYMDVVIDKQHIGVVPKEGDRVSYQGFSREVKRVEQHASSGQYRLRCE